MSIIFFIIGLIFILSCEFFRGRKKTDGKMSLILQILGPVVAIACFGVAIYLKLMQLQRTKFRSQFFPKFSSQDLLIINPFFQIAIVAFFTFAKLLLQS